MPLAPELESRLRDAIRRFWEVRAAQSKRQGSTGARDSGERTAVTGGAQMDGFANLVRDLLCEHGLPHASVHCERRLELPGWYRPEKQWDLIVVSDGQLLAGVEFQSQIGPSFGNNYNNRTEEALGSATDLWAAYREGAFRPSARPWLGYLMLLEDCPDSLAPVRARERLYDAACLLLAPAAPIQSGEFREPAAELSFENFVASLLAKAIAAGRVSGQC